MCTGIVNLLLFLIVLYYLNKSNAPVNILKLLSANFFKIIQ